MCIGLKLQCVKLVGYISVFWLHLHVFLSPPCRDGLESVTSLYNQVEEKLHMLVMRSNESLQSLEFLFSLRETEAKISTVRLSPIRIYQPNHIKMTDVVLNAARMEIEICLLSKKGHTHTYKTAFFYRLAHGSPWKLNRAFQTPTPQKMTCWPLQRLWVHFNSFSPSPR